jgi:asparagine synthase (glutamine-hydrolysing)
VSVVGVRGPAWVCAVGLRGVPLDVGVAEWTRVCAESAIGPRLGWARGGASNNIMVGLTPAGAPGAPGAVRLGDVVVVGSARLDNREVVRGWTGAGGPAGASDLELIGRAVVARGESCVRELLGDFAFVVWEPAARRVTAARDAFGVRAIYYRVWADRIAFASRASALTDGEAYDDEYFAEALLNGYDASERSPYVGVRAVMPGGLMLVVDGAVSARRYWSADEFEPAAHVNPYEAVEEFRRLFDEAVRCRLTGGGDTWAQLSGGVDSSSIVAVAGMLERRGVVARGVAGAITLVDSYDDESGYAREVAAAFGVRNDWVVDYSMWEDDDAYPPVTDEPTAGYPFWARNRRMCDIMRRAGGRVMMSGTGPDHYLTGNLYFFADWIARGKLGTALPELARWAILGKKPFWRFAGEYAVAPLLPAAVRGVFEPRWSRPPRWLDRRVVRQYGLARRTSWRRAVAAPRGRQYAGMIAAGMSHIPIIIDRGEFEDGIEMRYPFLSRALVEFSLKLPRELRTQPSARKWVLRQAVAGTLPDRVRTRRDKGGITGRAHASLVRERGRFEQWMRDPLIAQHGWVDRAALRVLFDRVVAEEQALLFPLVRVLAIETWLRVRVGQWSVRETTTGVDPRIELPAVSSFT